MSSGREAWPLWPVSSGMEDLGGLIFAGLLERLGLVFLVIVVITLLGRAW